MGKKANVPARPFGRIAELGKQLVNAGLAAPTRRKIMAGAEAITQRTAGKLKAAWLKGAMDRMDALLSPEVRQKVRQECACSTTGWRRKKIRALADAHPNLDEFARALTKCHLFGKEVRHEGSKLHVNFGLARCVCTPKMSQELFSVTYCYCCLGHVLKLLEAGLKRPLRGEVIGSACSGTPPCRFVVHLQ